MCANGEGCRTAGAAAAKGGMPDGWSSALQGARVFHSQAMRRGALQQHIAAASSKLLEDPEGNLPSLRALLELSLDDDAVVCCSHLYTSPSPRD